MALVTIEHHHGAYIIRSVNRRKGYRFSQLVQTDWDFPSVANSLGWRGLRKRKECNHSQTDGTVDCPECGAKASEFISAAAVYLDDCCNRLGSIRMR